MKTASTYPAGVPAFAVAKKTSNLANQPASGGMPARANRNTVINTVSPGAYSKSPLNDEISAERVFRATVMITANAPRFMPA